MKPPILARALVRFFSDAEDGPYLLEDLTERFRDVARTDGLRAARRWYWSQALSAVPWTLVLRGNPMRWSTWSGVTRDVRLGLRTVRRRPLYALGVAGTVGLALTAATLVFAVAWSVWLSPMPFPDPDRVVRIYELEPVDAAMSASDRIGTRARHLVSPPLLQDFRAESWRTIENVAAVTSGFSEWFHEGETQRVSQHVVTPEFFEILGITPVLGRLTTEPGGAEVFITERFWRRNFGADPDVVDATRMILNGRAHSIVGVGRLPPGYPGAADIVIIGRFTAADEVRTLRYIDAIARVRPGHSAAEARAEVGAFIAAIGEVYPQHRGWGADVVVLAEDLVRPFRGVIALLLAAVTTFLLLAGVNVLGVVAARRVEGGRDRSIRIALGASEGRLLRDALSESLILAAIGATAGVLGAHWLVGPIRTMMPQDVPRLANVAVGPQLMLSGIAAGIVLGLIIGLCGYLASRDAKPSVGRAPVWRAVGTGGRRALVVGQVALTTLLTAGYVGILHHVSTLRAIDLGFEPEGLSTATAVLGSDRYPSGQSRWDAGRAILDGLRRRGVPAAIAINTPMSGESVPPFGIRADASSDEIFFEIHLVSKDYFALMGIEFLAGQEFEQAEIGSPTDVVIVSEEFVRRYFGTGTRVGDVVGREVAPMPYQASGMVGPTISGVVRSTRHHGADAPLAPEVYVPLSRLNFAGLTLLVRGETDDVAPAVSAVLAQIDPDLRWTPLIPYTSHLKEWFAPLRLQIIMVGVLGALGLLLASLGLYAVMAYQVATRRQELGIRKAVGARDGRLLWGVLANGLAMAATGVLIGLGAWYQLRPWSRELVDGVESAGYLVPLSVFAVVGCSALLATAFPALKAMRVDPIVTLKAD